MGRTTPWAIWRKAWARPTFEHGATAARKGALALKAEDQAVTDPTAKAEPKEHRKPATEPQ
jgi:hypothetical protein